MRTANRLNVQSASDTKTVGLKLPLVGKVEYGSLLHLDKRTVKVRRTPATWSCGSARRHRREFLGTLPLPRTSVCHVEEFMKSRCRPVLRSISLIVLLLLVSCDGDSPTAPPAGGSRTGFVSGFAHVSSGACLPGAIVEVLDGPRAGARVTQADPCGSVWDYSGGYSFGDLPANSNVRLRASKSGYVTKESTFSTSGPAGQSNLLLVPE